MYKKIFTLIALLAGLQATAGGVEKVIELKSVESVTINHVGEDLIGDFESEVIITAEWEEVLYQDQEVTIIDTIQDTSCNPMNNNHWSSFYAPYASYYDRMNALKSIKGIGDVTARKIYQYWPRYAPPATWGEFKRLIRHLDRSVAPGIYANVVSQHGSYNKRNFGYQDICEDLVLVTTITKRVAIYREDFRTDRITVAVVGERAILLEGEKESVKVSMNNSGQITVTSHSKYNKFTTVEHTRTDDFSKITLIGKRKKFYPRNSISGVLTKEGSRLMAKFRVTGNYKKYADIFKGQMALSIDVKTKRDCFLCLISKKRTSKAVFISMNNTSEFTVDTGYDITSKDKIAYVIFKVKVQGSEFFVDRASSSKEIEMRLK